MRSADPATRIAQWQRRAGRHGLPWQGTRDPYRIWLSEIMLQQTQASTVIDYYSRFLALFPDVRALADSPLDAVLHAWAGLGYYARARNLHRCAQTIRDQYAGRFPAHAAELARLPGIGESTAAAIAAFAHGERAPILDGNVRRVLTRYYAWKGTPGTAAGTRQLWAWAHAWLDQAPAGLDMRAYTQGQMDLGATVCVRRNPRCDACPLAPDCQARKFGLQNELPAPRARRAQPQKDAWLLIAERDGSVLMQRRPEQGIWGGLWSLPEFPDAAALDAARRGLPPDGSSVQRLATVDHVFTHFRLHMHPVWHRCAPLPESPDGPPEGLQGSWVRLESLSRLGMPAPISRLLAGLYTGHL